MCRGKTSYLKIMHIINKFTHLYVQFGRKIYTDNYLPIKF